MGAIRLPERLPGVRRLRLIDERLQAAQGDQRIATQRRIRTAVGVQGIVELAEQLEADREAAIAAEAGPKRRASPVALGKKTKQQIALEGRCKKPVLRIVERHQRAVGFIPVSSRDIGVKQLDLFTGFVERVRRPAIGATSEEAGTRRMMVLRAEHPFEAAPNQRVRIDYTVPHPL